MTSCNGDLHTQECAANVDSGGSLLCHPLGRPLPPNMPAEHALKLFQQGQEAKEVEQWLTGLRDHGEHTSDAEMAGRTLDFISNLAMDAARHMAMMERQKLEMIGTRIVVETPEEKERALAAVNRLIERSRRDYH